MASHIFKVGDRSLIFGLDWSALVGAKKEAEEIREKLKLSKTNHFARSGGRDGDVVIGVPALENGGINGKVYSAALVFSGLDQVDRNSIIIWDLDETSTWVCVVKNGYPVVGKDLVKERSAAEIYARDEMSFSRDRLTVYGNNASIRSENPLNLEDIAFAANKDHLVRSNGLGISPAVLSTFVVLSLAVGGGYWYYSDMMEKKAAAELAAASQKEDPNITYKRSLDYSTPGIPAGLHWAKIKPVISSIPVVADGWKLIEINCDLAAINLCVSKWERVNGNNDGLRKALNLPDDTMWTIEGKHILYNIPLPAATETDPKVNLNNVPSTKEFMVKTISSIQDLSLVGLGVAVNPMTPYGVPPTISAAEVKPELMVNVGTWSTVASPFWMTDVFDEMPDSFVISNITVTVNDSELTFKSNGNYYAKN